MKAQGGKMAKKHIERITSPNGNITVWAVRPRKESEFDKQIKIMARYKEMQDRLAQLNKEILSTPLPNKDNQKDEQ